MSWIPCLARISVNPLLSSLCRRTADRITRGITPAGLAIIDVAECQFERDQLAFRVDNDVQLETLEPAHRRLAARGDHFKDLMVRNAPVVADGQGRDIGKGNANAVAFPLTPIDSRYWAAGAAR